MGNIGKYEVAMYYSEAIQTFAMLSIVNSFLSACVRWRTNGTKSKMNSVIWDDSSLRSRRGRRRIGKRVEDN